MFTALTYKKLTSFIFGTLLLFLPFTVEGEDPQSYPAQGQMVFRGLDTKSSPTQIADGRAQDLQNVQFTTTGGLKKRKGYSLVWLLDDIDGPFAAIPGLFYTRLSDGEDYVFAVEGDKLFRNGTAVGISDSTITADKNNQFVWTTALDNVIGTNNVNPPFKVTNSGNASKLDLTDLGSDAPTKVKCVAWFQNFVVLGNTVENSVTKSTRIRWSNIGTIETWTEEDRNDIDELGGQQIEAFGLLYDDLYIFLTTSVWKMSFVGGNEQFKFTKVLDKIGCIAKNSVQNVILQNSQRGLIFLTRDKKIYFFTGVTAQNISEVIEGTLDDLRGDRLQYAVSESTGEEYRLYVTTGASNTENNTTLLFNYRIGEWSVFDEINANAASRIVSSGVEYSYVGNYSSCVFKLDDGALDNDIDGQTGVVDAVEVFTTNTASGLQVLYDASASYTTSGLIGATIKLTGGTGYPAERVVADNTTTGIVVMTDFTTTPSTDTSFSVGAIDAYYETKFFDFGIPSRLKSFNELFLWAKEQGDVDLTLSYEIDFAGLVETKTLSQDGGGALWGAGIWGVATWGGVDALLARVKLSQEGRFLSFKVREADIDETFELYGYNILYQPRRQY